jgi:hypothetical protein
MQPVLRNLTRCLVCGFSEVQTDEVIDRGLVFLAECPRCEHRSTSSAPTESIRVRPIVRTSREVAPAA